MKVNETQREGGELDSFRRLHILALLGNHGGLCPLFFVPFSVAFSYFSFHFLERSEQAIVSEN